MQTREMVFGALLTALAMLIPTAFQGWLAIYLPPFTATLGAHVPSMLAMFISPLTAVLVGIGSTLGFAFTLGPLIAARAATHIVFGLFGANLFLRGFSPVRVLLATLPVHALLEALIVIPFGFSLYDAGIVVGVGTAIHHSIDAVIALSIRKALSQANLL
ncbi:MAG: ECF transporter S component [Firmicutes bacterium]|nr:ECF transporter S component [Bacillota bacterium]